MRSILSLLKQNLFSLDLIDDKQGNHVLQLTIVGITLKLKKWKQKPNQQ